MLSKSAAAAPLTVLLLSVVLVAGSSYNVGVDEAAAEVGPEVEPSNAPAMSDESGGYEDYSEDELTIALKYPERCNNELRPLAGASERARWQFVERQSRDAWVRYLQAERNRTSGWRRAVEAMKQIDWSEVIIRCKNETLDLATCNMISVFMQSLFYETAYFHMADEQQQEHLDRLRAFLLHRFSTADELLNLTNTAQLLRQVASVSPFTGAVPTDAERRARLDLQKKALEAWLQWSDSVAPLMKRAFTLLVDTLNEKTRFLRVKQVFGLYLLKHVENFWLHQLRTLESRHFPEVDWIDALWGAFKPLYAELHAFVRTRALERTLSIPVSRSYFWAQQAGHVGRTGGDWVRHKWVAAGLLPEHVLGSMWAEDWTAFASPSSSAYNNSFAAFAQFAALESEINEENEDALIRRATGLFEKFGFKLPPGSIHWAANSTRCIATAWNMFDNRSGHANESSTPDLRVRVCRPEANDEKWFERLVYAMSQVHYMQNASRHPFLFAKPLTPAFSVAVGGLFRLLATSPAYHLHYVRSENGPSLVTLDPQLLSDPEFERSRVQYLLRVALELLPRMAFSHTLEKWRAAVFSGDVSPDEYNAHWWELECRIRGLFPPSPRPLDGFDVGATYEIASGEFVLPALLGRMLQFQLLAQLCAEGGFDGPLDLCDLRHEKLAANAGERLRLVMGLGASESWLRPQWTLLASNLSSLTYFDPKPLLTFFKPLRHWLREQLDDSVYARAMRAPVGAEGDGTWYAYGWDRSMCAEAVFGRPLRSSELSHRPAVLLILFQLALMIHALYKVSRTTL